jgi:hypothetical protein
MQMWIRNCRCVGNTHTNYVAPNTAVMKVAVGRLALNIDSELFALFPKILHYFKENLTRLCKF